MKFLRIILCVMLACEFSFAFTKQATADPTLVQSGEKKQWCSVCGMSLKKFYKTSHVAYLNDGTPRQYCSLRCLVEDHLINQTDISNSKVVDAVSEKLISTKDAFYVVGSKVKGTMSKVSKLAFAKKTDAQEFIKKMGGELKNFKQAYDIAKADLSDDILMLEKKREKMLYPMGKRIYQKKCKTDKLNAQEYLHVNELKVNVFKYCDNLKEKQAQAVAAYLWHEKNNEEEKIIIDKNDKCPVCGMFVSKFSRWIAQIQTKDTHYSFDGVKDMGKFLHNPQKYGAKDSFKVEKILVTDYYTQKIINAKKAYFVQGSDVYGPMGAELIPFKSQSDAKTFLKDHKGTKIITLDQITHQIICELDGEECK